ncbi:MULTISPECIES: serine O-acetyltransferase [unclassified Shinella]|uniref:serine O-acetyltransferase n=1 Tax=unclassified Shinella TaxID=2643062 RepID=UPI000A43FFB6|nr:MULTISPECIES: serine O-acetyltransferase [unclassified Shinella]MCO5150627.1 serine O-acetyltransferase [Shinella sp.]MDC7263362.1 serine O-acetyltransferase [Shinella sp. HY16]MDC7270257.1 serine O-acetyltransferase [Shinella sp. YZ44]
MARQVIDFASPIASDTEGRVWTDIRAAAQLRADEQPRLATLLHPILAAKTGRQMLIGTLAARLAHTAGDRALAAKVLASTEDGALLEETEADLLAIVTRDPANPDPLTVLLHLKGFQALQVHRFAHRLWQAGRMEGARWLSSQASLAFGLDIHPAARMGRGIMLDHGSGIVIGETVVVEDDVSMLQQVTLGGTGRDKGDRHPKVRRGVLIGAGAKILGNIEIGAYSKIAAGSVVLEPVPAHTTVAGVPARIVRVHSEDEMPAATMDHRID